MLDFLKEIASSRKKHRSIGQTLRAWQNLEIQIGQALHTTNESEINLSFEFKKFISNY